MTEKEKYESLVIQDLIRVLVPPKSTISLMANLNYYLRRTKLSAEKKSEIRKDFKKIAKIQQQSNNQIRLIKNDLYLKFCGEPYILDDIK